MNKAMSIPAAGILAITFAGLNAACADGDTGAIQPLGPLVSETPGSISITVSTTGLAPDANAYTVTVDGSESHSLPTGGTLLIPDLAPGDHTIQLADVVPNCSSGTNNPQVVNVASGGTTEIVFNVMCAGVIVDSILSVRLPLGSN